MSRRHLILVAFLLAFMPGAVCVPGDPDPDASVPDGDVVDMGVADDMGVLDGGDDAGGADAGMDGSQPDAAADGGSDSGQPVDAGPCGMECVASDPCRMAACDVSSGMCVETPLPDGVLCGEGDDLLCVGGTCEVRRCGDGYRERGTDPLWPREGCDDRNALDDDICSMGCEPTEFVPRVDSGGEEYSVRYAATGQLLVVDGLGNGLLVWVQHHVGFGEERQELRASRMDPYGNFLDLAEPLLLDTTTLLAFDMTPSAVGLRTGGFTVAWTAQRTVANVPAFKLLMRRIEVTGAMSAERDVHPPMLGAQRFPSMTALSEGFVVVWQDDGAQSDVWGRRFRDSGAPMTTVMGLASSTAGGQSAPSVAAIENDWMVTFLSQVGDVVTAPVQVRARRFRDNGPLGSDFGLVSADASTQSITALGEGYALAYTSTATDAKGDLHVMSVPRMSGELPGMALALDTSPMVGAADPRVAPYGPRELGAFVVVYHDNAPVPAPLFMAVGLTPPSEVDSLLLMTRGEHYPVVAPASYELTGGSVWFGYTAPVEGGHVGAVVFQLPPP